MESDLSLLTVDVHLYKDRAPLGGTLTDYAVSGTTYTYTTRLNSFSSSDSGNYMCSTSVGPNDQARYLMGSGIRMSENIVITTGLLLCIKYYNYVYVYVHFIVLSPIRCISIAK